MRQSGSDFGYLAPARDFSRTASIVLVAGAVGATAAAGAVFALVGGPSVDSSLATPAVTRSVESAVIRTAAPTQAKRTIPPSAPPMQAARVNAPSTVQEKQQSPARNDQPAVEATNELETTPASPAEGVTAPVERAAVVHDSAAKTAGAAATAGNATAVETSQPEKKAYKKPALFSRYAWRSGFFRDNGRWGGGFYRDRGWRHDVW
jgi:hypothetical protein